jgi:hypothetical protein
MDNKKLPSILKSPLQDRTNLLTTDEINNISRIAKNKYKDVTN